MLASYPNTQGGDGPFFHKMLEVVRVSVLRYHELPLWNPFECGGVPLWDNPQGIAAAPIAWLTFLFGTTRAIELWYIVHSAIGFYCMWLLCRSELKLSRAACLIAAASWAFAGVHNQHQTGGHLVWSPFLYFPLGIFLWRRAERDNRAAVGLGLLVAWMMCEGAVYSLPHLALVLGAETLTRASSIKRVLPIARAGAIVLVSGISVGAARFFPVLHQLRTHTRAIVPDTDAMQWLTLKDVFLARSHDRFVPGQQYVWPEFGDYLGPFLLGLAVVGVLLAGKKYAWIVAMLVVSVLMMLGHQGRLAPWTILHGHIYPFKEMRVPSRFVTEVSLFLSTAIGIAVHRIELVARLKLKKGGRGLLRATRLAVFTFALVGVGDMISVGITWCAVCFTNAPQKPTQPSTRLFLGGPALADFLDQPQQNRGRVQCWEEWSFQAGAPLWEGDLPQARAEDDGAIVEVANRTPNTFSLDVDVKRDGAKVLLNTSWDRGWRTDVGTIVESNKQLAVELPKGRYRIKLHYWPHGLTAGLVLTLLGLAGTAAFFLWHRRRLAGSPGGAAPHRISV
jgi:hypothetical protein